MKGREGRAAIWVLAASVLWGTTGTAAAQAPLVGSLAIGAAAMGVGGLLQAATAARSLRRSRSDLLAQWRYLALSSGAVAVYPLAFYSSMRLAGVATGTVISIGSAPAAAAVIERLAEGRPLSRRWTMGTALGVAGVVALAAGPGAGQTGGTSHVLGTCLGLVAGFTYAAYSWGAARVMRAGVPSRPAMGAIFGLGGLLLMPVLVATGGPIMQSGHNLAVAIYMAVVPMYLGYTLFGRGLAAITASVATTLSLLEPAVATLLATLVLHERLPIFGWVGLASVLAGLLVITMPAQLLSGRDSADPGRSRGRWAKVQVAPAADRPGSNP